MCARPWPSRTCPVFRLCLPSTGAHLPSSSPCQRRRQWVQRPVLQGLRRSNPLCLVALVLLRCFVHVGGVRVGWGGGGKGGVGWEAVNGDGAVRGGWCWQAGVLTLLRVIAVCCARLQLVFMGETRKTASIERTLNPAWCARVRPPVLPCVCAVMPLCSPFLCVCDVWKKGWGEGDGPVVSRAFVCGRVSPRPPPPPALEGTRRCPCPCTFRPCTTRPRWSSASSTRTASLKVAVARAHAPCHNDLRRQRRLCTPPHGSVPRCRTPTCRRRLPCRVSASAGRGRRLDLQPGDGVARACVPCAACAKRGGVTSVGPIPPPPRQRARSTFACFPPRPCARCAPAGERSVRVGWRGRGPSLRLGPVHACVVVGWVVTTT